MDDINLRRALNHAISQETIVETVLESVGEPARGPISPVITRSAHEELPQYEQDPETATALVDDSMYSGEELVFAVRESIVDGDVIAATLQSSFSEIGVETDVRLLDDSSFQDFVREGHSHLTLSGSSSNSAAADYIMFENFHSEGIDNIQLYEADGTGISNPGEDVDDLIEEGYQSYDEDTTSEAYRTAQQLLIDEAATIPICYNEYTIAMHADIDGIDSHPIDKMVDWTTIERTDGGS